LTHIMKVSAGNNK